MNIRFEKANLNYKDVIFAWLEEPHVMEFWDNSQKHKDDILNFMNGRKEQSNYFGGLFVYWVGLVEDEVYCLIMTHEENESTDPPEYFKQYLSKSGKTFGLDFCIGNKSYFNKGLGSLTLEVFIKYFSKKIEPEADTFLIDPYTSNPRAIHVYKKAGFEIMQEFIQEGGYFDQSKGVLMVKTL